MTRPGEPGPWRVIIAGAGIRNPGHLTLETLDALSQCDEIFTILTPELAARLPGGLSARVQSLWVYYQPGMRRREAYADEISAILTAAEKGRAVAYLTIGNPVLFDSVTQGLLSEAQRRGIGVEILSAVSAIDTIFTDLRQDIAPGCQIYDASSIVAYEIMLRPDIPCLLLQPDLFGTAYVAIGHQPTTQAMRPLKEYLLRFYPPSHPVTYVTSAVVTAARPRLDSFPLAALGGSDDDPQAPGASLFIPAAATLVPDQDFVTRMSDARSFSESFRRSAQPMSATVWPAGPDRDYNVAVLLSGGLDSAVLLREVVRSHGHEVLALHLAGMSSPHETAAARELAAEAAVDLHVLEVSGLTSGWRAPHPPAGDQSGRRAVLGAAAIYMTALAFALARGIPEVAIGLHRDDADSWVEQSPGFLGLIREAVRMVGEKCELLVPFQDWTKTEVVRRGAELGVDLSRTWSCLSPRKGHQDGTCGACRARRKAFRLAGIADVTAYRSGDGS